MKGKFLKVMVNNSNHSNKKNNHT